MLGFGGGKVGCVWGWQISVELAQWKDVQGDAVFSHGLRLFVGTDVEEALLMFQFEDVSLRFHDMHKHIHL